MKTKKLTISVLVAVMLPTISFANNINATLASHESSIDHPHPQVSQEGTPQWVLDAREKSGGAALPNPLDDVGVNSSRMGSLSTDQVNLEFKDDIFLSEEAFEEIEDNDADAANDVLSFINDRIKVDLISKTSQFEEVDQYNAEIKRAELRSELAKKETEVIKSQLEIKRLRDELKVDKTREYVTEKVLHVYNGKVRELKTKNIKDIDSLALKMDNKIDNLNKIIFEKDSEIAKNIKESDAAIKEKEDQFTSAKKDNNDLMNEMVVQINDLNMMIGVLEDKVDYLENLNTEEEGEGRISVDDIALSKITGREGNLKAKLYFEDEIIEVRENDDILNEGVVFAKEINQTYIILHFPELGEDATLYPMGDARAATYIYNQKVKKINFLAKIKHQEALEQEAQRQLTESKYNMEANDPNIMPDEMNYSAPIMSMPLPPQGSDSGVSFPGVSTLYNANGEAMASGPGS